MKQRRRQLLSALGGVVALAGCIDGSDGGGTAQPATTQPSQTNSTDTPTSPAETSDSGTAAQKLTASDGAARDEFGASLSVSDAGSTAVVGAPNHDSNGENAGAAYVFAERDGTWQQQAKLTPDDGDAGDTFGRAVGMASDGSTAIVGAPADEDPNGEKAGSAYVFAERDGTWQQQAKLTPDDGDAKDSFGWAVAISGAGSTAIVGARSDRDPNGDGAGSAYVFAERDGAWQQQAKLAANDGDPVDFFGVSVALSGDGSTAIIGAWADQDPNGSGAGSAYVFAERDGAWQQQAKLAADDGDSGDAFGFAVAVSNDGSIAIIGAMSDEDPNGEKAGSAYVFAEREGAWQQQTKLAAADGDPRDSFGRAVGISGDGSTAVVGAEDDADSDGFQAGSAYVFSKRGEGWRQEAKYRPDDGDLATFFGASVAVAGDGSTTIVGATGDVDPKGDQAGSAYVFE